MTRASPPASCPGSPLFTASRPARWIGKGTRERIEPGTFADLGEVFARFGHRRDRLLARFPRRRAGPDGLAHRPEIFAHPSRTRPTGATRRRWSAVGCCAG